MFTFEYRFYPKNFLEPHISEFNDEMVWFLSALENNGQILSAYQNTVVFNDCYACRVVAPEKDSLDEKYFNRYCSECFQSVTAMSTNSPELLFVGQNFETEECCSCSEINSYILYTSHLSEAPPIICGKCRKSVPLYKFPKTYDSEEYWDIRWWQRLYQACDTQYMGGVGERHGYKMMNDPHSTLSKEGLKFCVYMEERVGKPFYYFLFKYYSKNKFICPKCGKPWINENRTEPDFEYVCQTCKFVSDDCG